MEQEAFDPASRKGVNNDAPPPQIRRTQTHTNTFSDCAPLKEMIDFYESLNYSDKILFVHSSVFMLFGSDWAYKMMVVTYLNQKL